MSACTTLGGFWPAGDFYLATGDLYLAATGIGLGLLIMFWQAGMCLLAVSGAYLLVQCGQGTLSSAACGIEAAILSSMALSPPFSSHYFIYREILIEF